jgi:3-hydroxyisobutyrate dehydrogenase-like beta-hydroxyacid dehydrogenase
MEPVAFIGLGAMGLPMARRLVACGHPVAVHDVRPERCAEVAGAAPATTAAAAAAAAAVVLVMVRSADDAEAVMDGAQGVIAGLATGGVVLLMSTIGPAAARRLGARIADAGGILIDAPVSGGATRAAAGDLVIMASGDAGALRRVRPILDALGSTVADCGPEPGDAQAVKLVNQVLCGIHIAAAAEALAFAERLGLDPAAVFEVIRKGAAGSFMLDDRGPRMLATAEPEVRSALALFVKDLALVTESANAATPLAATALRLFEEAAAQGLAEHDDSQVIRALRARPKTTEA